MPRLNSAETLAGTPATDTAFWTPPPGSLGSAADLFDETVYDRGAMTLQALREKVGDATFLDHFFDVWLRQPRKPTSW